MQGEGFSSQLNTLTVSLTRSGSRRLYTTGFKQSRNKVSSLTVVVEELGDEVHVGEEHAAAAVALQAELVQGPAGVLSLLLEELQVLVPLVADDLNLS